MTQRSNYLQVANIIEMLYSMMASFTLQVLVVGGITTLFAALFGFYVTMKEDSCLMITYAVIMSIEFLLMVTGIVCTVDLLFIIQTGLFDSDVIPELTLYETDPWVRHKWDTMQSKDGIENYEFQWLIKWSKPSLQSIHNIVFQQNVQENLPVVVDMGMQLVTMTGNTPYLEGHITPYLIHVA